MQITEQRPGRIEPMVGVRTLRLITYGLGKKYKKELFVPIKNRCHNKPTGGLWASPVGCNYGWREWAEAESLVIGGKARADKLSDAKKKAIAKKAAKARWGK